MNKQKRILLIDDETTIRQATAELLRRAGYHCDEAKETGMGLRLFRQGIYDAVVVDIRLPGNTELDIVRKIMDLEPSIPVIIITGYPSIKTKAKGANLGVQAYLIKPFDVEDLLTQLP